MIKRIPILIFILILVYIYFKDETFTDKTITIGTSIPKTGIIKAWGDSVTAGADSYFRFVNEENLLNDKKIDLLIYDDKYEPELTIDNANKLLFKDKVFALFGFVGTPTVKSILPILYDEKIPFFGSFSGASFLRNNSHDNVVNFRSSYDEEIEAIVSHLHEKEGLSSIAVFYQNDDYGEEGYISLLKSLKKRNLPLVAQGSYKRNTFSINHAFNEIKDANPQAIIMVGSYKTNSLFIKKAKKNEKLKDTIFCNLSFGDANEMIKELKSQKTDTKNLLFSQVVPNYTDTKIPAILEYQSLMKKYYPEHELGFISLEAFLSAKVLVHSIKNIKGDITREKFLCELKEPSSNILEGINLKFKNSQLLNKVYLFHYKDSKFIEVKK